MRDGVKIAADIYPTRTGAPGPTILHQTRYFRSVRVRRRAGRRLEAIFESPIARMRHRFMESGYAWVDVDVRGSGASFGVRPCPWSPDEVDDGVEVATWIVSQPWSDGAVGGLGNSYSGTAAEHLMTRHHPAVRAVAPRFSLYDVYADVLAPGGVHLQWFTQQWNRVNCALDRDAFHEAFALNLRLLLQSERAGGGAGRGRGAASLDRDGVEAAVGWWARALLAAGVRPVDDDPRGVQLAAAVAEHRANYDVEREAGGVVFRDDLAPSPDPFPGHARWRSIPGSVNRFSPHSWRAEAEASGVPVFSYSGWLDAGYQHSAIKRHLTVRTPGSRLILGPWEHGGSLNISPHDATRLNTFDHAAELLAFFDRHLRGVEGGEAPTVRYFTLGEERWKSAETWPPPEVRREALYLGAGGALASAPLVDVGADTHHLDPAASTGQRSRWRSFIGPHRRIGYPDRAAQDRNLPVYDSPPLLAPLEVTGHPVVRLFLASEAPDGAVFAYLEEVTPSGEVLHVTEGALRLLHRRLEDKPTVVTPAPSHSFLRADGAAMPRGEVVEVVLGLLPISWRFGRGSRVRLALAGADVDNFGVAEETLGRVEVWRGGGRASRLELPVVVEGAWGGVWGS